MLKNMSKFHDSVALRQRYDTATAKLAAPLAIVDLDAFDANGAAMRERAVGLPIRVASKSLRCRQLLRRALAGPGYAGILSFSLAESLWLVENEVSRDVVVGYPDADALSIAALATDSSAAAAITLMVDDVAQLDLVDAVLPPVKRHRLRVCLDLDASYRVLGNHLGTRRSPVHTPLEAVRLARKIKARKGFDLVGIMSYEGQIAGLGQGSGPSASMLRLVQDRSFRELVERRGKAVAAVRQVAELEFVNGGGTGSLSRTASDPSITELTAGSGFYGPALFDEYDDFRPRPAAAFALSVVRRPGPGFATVHGGGWIASGKTGPSRQPRPWLPSGLRLTGMEAAGEVQTPVTGPAADSLRVGDRVWFRHAKAGELCERVNELHLVEGDRIADTVPTYRGEGKAFL
ncbi:alanine racemase domain protein [Stackebrandtia nassauensis DSM 44728]|uniref:Alanine racemase domain protein n=2 Tax=Stackebrandtia TaxID=283810 RepID=D3Q852_STANL|nr:alanine racemase domain protein [Stackebrandtia nassauensis DSM 44728]